MADAHPSTGEGLEGAPEGRWTLDVPGRLDEIPRARELAATIARDLRLDQAGGFQLKVALHEAVANAVEHGCRRPDDRVRVRACADDTWLVVDVCDPGGRYEPSPDTMRDALAARGRGNMLLAATTDDMSVDVGTDGTRLRLRKRL